MPLPPTQSISQAAPGPAKPHASFVHDELSEAKPSSQDAVPLAAKASPANTVEGDKEGLVSTAADRPEQQQQQQQQPKLSRKHAKRAAQAARAAAVASASPAVASGDDRADTSATRQSAWRLRSSTPAASSHVNEREAAHPTGSKQDSAGPEATGPDCKPADSAGPSHVHGTAASGAAAMTSEGPAAGRPDVRLGPAASGGDLPHWFLQAGSSSCL